MAAEPPLDTLRSRITADYRRPESDTVAPLLAEAALSETTLRTAQSLAASLAEAVRRATFPSGSVMTTIAGRLSDSEPSP